WAGADANALGCFIRRLRCKPPHWLFTSVCLRKPPTSAGRKRKARPFYENLWRPRMIPWRKPSSSADENEAAKRILVIQLGALAELVQALGAAKRIREHHFGARITLLTTDANKELAEKCPYFDTVECDGKPTEPQTITKLIARIRAAKYDMIYDLEGSNRTN